ncbi:unnamed protein product [Meloidogyne enterolobii]|uniref:Uncharacterized protein n=1 Tax=Meloidogyne enterolobii TaxID=390850 RepID=A0ACB1A0D4_MELEN
MYRFVVCTRLSYVLIYLMYPFVVCSLLSYVQFCRKYSFVVCSLLSFTPFCHVSLCESILCPYILFFNFSMELHVKNP